MINILTFNKKKLVKNLVRIFNINECVVSVTFKSNERYKMKMIQVYAPTSSYNDEEDDIKFCKNVQSVE